MGSQMDTRVRRRRRSAVALTAVSLALALCVAAADDRVLPTGTFSSEGARLTLADGRFRLEREQSLLVNGSYRVKDDQVTFEDEGGPMACAAAASGRYRWTYDGKQLAFSVADDPCAGRATGLARPWAAEQNAPKK